MLAGNRMHRLPKRLRQHRRSPAYILPAAVDGGSHRPARRLAAMPPAGHDYASTITYGRLPVISSMPIGRAPMIGHALSRPPHEARQQAGSGARSDIFDARALHHYYGQGAHFPAAGHASRQRWPRSRQRSIYAHCRSTINDGDRA